MARKVEPPQPTALTTALETLNAEWQKVLLGDPSFCVATFVQEVEALLGSKDISPEAAALRCPTLLKSPLPGAPEAGRTILESLSRTGEPHAVLNLAVAYLAGHGGAGDATQGAELLLRLIDLADLEPAVRSAAQLQLAQCYRDGRGVSRDIVLAVELYEKAAAGGQAFAAFAGGIICQGETQHRLPTGADYARAERLYKMGGQDVRCETNLGLLHIRGLALYPHQEEGLALLKRAALRGDPHALSELMAYKSLGEAAALVLKEWERDERKRRRG